MQIVTHPAALPACCVVCRGGVGPFVDTELQFDWYGAMYICSDCILHTGRMIGMISKDQAEKLIAENVAASEARFELETKLARLTTLESTLNDLVDSGVLGSRLGVAGSSGRSGEALSDFLKVVDGSSGEGAPGAEDDLESGAGKAAEPLHDEGVDVLRSDERQSGEFII